MTLRPKGSAAANWRKRKFDALRHFTIPEDLLPGTLVLGHRRCGKPSCRCAQGEGHASWTLTFMTDRKKRVEHIPADIVEDVQRRVDAGRAFKEALTDVMSANAELLALERKQLREQRLRKSARKHHG